MKVFSITPVRTLLSLAAAALLVHASAYAGGRVVAIDQLGYTPTMQKFVFSAQAADSFAVLSVPTGSSVFRGGMILWQSLDGATGHPVYRGDFSSVQSPGRYRVVTTHGDTSAPFSVSDSVFTPALRKTLKGFYFQRCGMQLLPAFAGVYQHGVCHPFDGVFHSTADSAGKGHLVTGGWHDAGDYGKYVVNAGISAGTLLLAYEMFPARFSFDDLGIPESGNGVPDILDEARYELEWFLKMQRADGAFWFKVTPKQFEGFVMPQADSSPRYIYQVSTTGTGDATAVLAKAARLFAPFDSAFAVKCLSAARRGDQFLANNLYILPAGGFTNPPDTYTGVYGDGDDSDERLWASAELFETTGDSLYNAEFLSGYAFGSLFTEAMSWPNVRSLALLTYLRSAQPAADASVRSELGTSLAAYCAGQVARRNDDGYHSVLRPGEYYWGSNSQLLNAAILLLAGYARTGDTADVTVAADQLHYMLGTNGFARSYVTGLGENPPLHPHHRPSSSDGIADPVPGLLAGGPNQYGGDPALQVLINSGAPPALCYIDTVASYASNEIAINWNAPLVFVAGFFGAAKGTEGVDRQRRNSPLNFRLEQNYPNPFNPVTKIQFSIVNSQLTIVKVFDVLGREVATLVNEVKQPGVYTVQWNASGIASGVYLYRLQAWPTEDGQTGSFVETKRMMVLK